LDPEKVVTEFCAHWARGDVDAIVDAFTDDAVYHNMPMAPCEGKEAIRAFVGGMFGTMATSVLFDIKHQIASGNVVMNERVDTIVMKDREVALPVAGVFELTPEGKIAAWRDYFDAAQFAGG
jgi:limonene-1,2-epoxide hydrolase